MPFRLTPPKPRLSEDDVIARCRKLCERRGYFLRRNPVGRWYTASGEPYDFGPEGIPDYTAVHARYPAFFVEFKRPGKTLREGQQSKFEEIQFGFKLAAVMVDCAEDLKDFIDGHEQRARSP